LNLIISKKTALRKRILSVKPANISSVATDIGAKGANCKKKALISQGKWGERAKQLELLPMR
jgi:hypothetical protein